MLVTRVLNACHHFPGFVYASARLIEAHNNIEIEVRSRSGSKAVCSGCAKPAPGYDQAKLPRRFEFIPVWGFAVMLLYCMRRVECRNCGVTVEQVPWGIGKHTLTRAYMLHLAHWARKLSWQDTARSFRTSLEQVYQAVEYVVQWGYIFLPPPHTRSVSAGCADLRLTTAAARQILVNVQSARVVSLGSAGTLFTQKAGKVLPELPP